MPRIQSRTRLGLGSAWMWDQNRQEAVCVDVEGEDQIPLVSARNTDDTR